MTRLGPIKTEIGRARTSGWISAGLAEEQQGGGAELGDNRRAVDVVAGAEPGTVVDRRLDPALG